jgi:hypothetical protein
MAKKYTRRLRHWKQQYDPNAEFVFTKPITYGPKKYKAGDKIPDELFDNKTKLRRFWESKTIELYAFETPDVTTGQVAEQKPWDEIDLPEGLTVEQGNGSWLTIKHGEEEAKVNGVKGLTEYIATLSTPAPTADDGDDTSGNDDESPDAGIVGKLKGLLGLSSGE